MTRRVQPGGDDGPATTYASGPRSQLDPVRLAAVSRLLASRVAPPRIEARFTEEWGLSERQVRRYIQAARDEFRARWERSLEDHAADMLATLDTTIEESFRTSQPAVAVSAVREIARLRGLNAPTTPAQVQAMQINVAQQQTVADAPSRDQEESELLRKLERLAEVADGADDDVIDVE